MRSAHNTWQLAAAGEGTDITLTGAIETRGGPVVARLVAGRVGRANEELVADLAAHVTRRPA